MVQGRGGHWIGIFVVYISSEPLIVFACLVNRVLRESSRRGKGELYFILF